MAGSRLLLGVGNGGAAPPPFTPTDIAGLAAWFKADGTLWQDSARTTSATADADPVGAWDDAGSNGYHATQATAAKRPTLKLAIQNGKPVLRFDGTDDFLGLSGAALNISQNVGGMTIFAVANSSSSASDRRVVGIDRNAAGNVRICLARNIDSTNAGKLSLAGRRLDGDARFTVTGGAASYADGTWDIEAGVFDFTNNLSALWKNGSSIATGTTGGAGSTSNTGSTASAIGAQGGATGGLYFAGDVAEVLIYQAALNDTQMGQVFTNLNGRWGVY